MCDNDFKDKLDFATSTVQRQPWQLSNPLWTVVLSLLSLFSITIQALLFLFFRNIIDIYLKFRNGEVYGGLVAKEDMAFFIPDKSKCCITIVTYSRSNKPLNMIDNIKEILQEKILNHPDDYPKLTSGVYRCCGYFYRIKQKLNINDLVKSINLENDQELTEEYLKIYTARVIDYEFGNSGSVLWDIHVASQPIKGNLDDQHYRYPIIWRIHHSIADGTSLVSLFIQLFGDESSENYNKELFDKLLSNRISDTPIKTRVDLMINIVVRMVKRILLYVEIIFMSFGRLSELNQLMQNDINSLHGKKYTGKKVCAWATEDKIQIVPLVKNIKNRENTKFSCVVCTAIAASLSNYFKRNHFPIPEYMSGAIAVLLEYPDVDQSKPIKLKNRTGATTFKLPMIFGSTTLVDLLKNVSKAWNNQMRLADGLLVAFLMQKMLYMPIQLLSIIFGWYSHTFVLSNVPGGSMLKTRDGSVFEKNHPYRPYYARNWCFFCYR